jgi:carbon-monoxide dehydrogenase large subunit
MTDVAPAEPRGTTRYAGSRVPRVEDARLLTGHGTYTDDVTLPGTLHAAFVRSPFARARVRAIDTAAALALPGVHAVYTAADLNPGMKEQWHTSMGPDALETPRPPLAEDEVRFVGDPVVLVVADSRYVAEDAAELVDVDYEPLTPVVDYVTAGDQPELVHEAHGSNVVEAMDSGPNEDLDAAFANAAHVVTETIYQQAYVPVPMEGRGILIDCNPSTGDITIWAATQAPHEVRLFCARLLGVPEHRIRVVMRDTGGGFGQKVLVQRDEMAVMLAAPKLGRPLKWIEDRRENLLSAGKARQEHGLCKMAFDEDGVLQGVHLTFSNDAGSYPAPWPTMTAVAVCMFYPGPYRVPLAGYDTRSIYTNTPGRTAYRGPWQSETLFREMMYDIAARQIGMDPAEIRRKNIIQRDELPFFNPNGMLYDSISPAETLEQALEILDYDAFRAKQAELREQGRYIGVGISNYVEPSTPGYGYYGTEAATIRIEPSGKVNVYIAGGSTGNSLETTVVQLTADALGVKLEDVSTIQGDTALTGFGAGTGGSRSGSMMAGAVRETASILRERIIAIAAEKLEAAPEDIELDQSRATVKGTPGVEVSLAEIAHMAYLDSHDLPEGVPAGLEASARYRAESMMIWVNATHICTCEVDVETGEITLLRFIVSEDCGPMINPNVVEGQIAGGVVQGIGGAILEELAYDADGNPLATTFADYLLPTSTEVPVIEYGHIETPSPGPGGYKGVGEGGAIGAPPAVVNAIADALAPFGKHITRTPVTPAMILDLVKDGLVDDGKGAQS